MNTDQDTITAARPGCHTERHTAADALTNTSEMGVRQLLRRRRRFRG